MNPKKLLVVSAHAADWCTRSGGTLLKYADLGYQIKVICFTFGVHGESLGFWRSHPSGPERACEEVREREARNAAAYIGAQIEFRRLRDYPMPLQNEDVVVLSQEILDFRPDLVLTHWKEDSLNIDHQVVSAAVVRAVSCAARLGARPDTPAHKLPDLFFFESTLPYTEFNHFEINTYVDISDVFERKLQALRLFEAQPELIGLYTDCAKQRAKQASDFARERGKTITAAEAFYRYLPFVGKELPLSDD